ncbi:unnamed protein product [Effrenium voratum]|nr:unnamed protein product [Effrenium voratum]
MKLCYAAAAGDPVAVSALLVAGYDADAADYAGKTPLHIACTVNSTGSREVVKVLLEHGVRVNRLDSLGQTPLDICLRARNFEMCRLLEDYGAKVQREELEFKARESFWLLHPEDIKLRKQIGKTLKSAVHLATWRGTRVVVKCAKLHHTSVVRNMAKSKSWVPGAGRLAATPKKKNLQELITEELLKEIQMLASLRHPDLVLFMGAVLDPGYPVMFVTEFMEGGDLEHHMRLQREKHKVQHWSPPLEQMLEWCLSVSRALSFLHNFDTPIIHRDLKPLNLLLTKHLDIKVTDFGISKMLRNVDHKAYTAMTGGVGSWLYMAPEVVRHEEYDEKVDIYSFGLIMYYLSSGRRPFYQVSLNPKVVLQEFLDGKEPRPVIQHCHAKLRSVVRQSWHEDPQQRPSADEINTFLEEARQKPGHRPCLLM